MPPSRHAPRSVHVTAAYRGSPAMNTPRNNREDLLLPVG